MELRKYQVEALQAVNDYEAKGTRKQLIVLPTGTGKTVIFAHLPDARPDSLPMLVVGHREELLTQAKEKIEHANPGLRVAIEQGSNYAGRADVVIASVATIGRADSIRLKAFEKDYFRSVIIDEAHHAAAISYRRVLEYFDSAIHIGVTATPQRGDNTRLTDVFDEIVYFKTLKEMILDGYLSGLKGFRVKTDVDISGVSTRAGDFAEGELATTVNTPERNALIVKSYRELVPDKKALVFCVDVAHAKKVNEAFLQAEISSAIVTGSTPSEVRADILRQFKAGDIKVICNCMVLTEGFDEPSIEAIIMARPTQSQLLYTQIVGRGTRLASGKSHCIVIDVADTTRNKTPVGLPTLMGLAPEFDLAGQDLVVTVGEVEKLEVKSPTYASQVKSLADIEAAWEKIDLFTPPPPNPAILEYSTFIWSESGPGKYVLGLGPKESIILRTDSLGRSNIDVYDAVGSTRLAQAAGLHEGFAIADRWIQDNKADKVVLLDVNAPWRSDPPTDKQIKWLRKNGVPYEHLSKGEASLILDQLFANSVKKPKPAWLQKKIDGERNQRKF